MNDRRTDTESETGTDSTAQRRVDSVESNSQGDIDPVASLHSVVGNQAVESLVNEGRATGAPSGSAKGESERSATIGWSGGGTDAVGETIDAVVQAKLTIGTRQDRYEREAERVASQVLRQSVSKSDSGVAGETGRRTGQRPASPPTGAVPETVATAVASGGRPLSPSERSFFEPRFGRDFRNVRVHTDSRADEAARQMNAEALTVENHIVFRAGNYRPETRTGKRLLAHELVHTIQQGSAGTAPMTEAGGVAPRTDVGTRVRATVQRLIKNDHPWTGAVVDTPSLALRDDPQVRSGANENTLADLSRGAVVTVVGTSGQWLELEVDTSQKGIVLNQRGRNKRSGETLRGYSYHEYVDDAVAAKMSDLVGEKAKWIGSGPGGTNTFAQWASAPSESEAPPVERTTTINCWEMILLAAYKIGAVDWKSIHDLYTSSTTEWGKKLKDKLTSGPRKPYDPSNTGQLERGDIVFFDGIAHVTLATGNGDEVLTFWPPPNTDFERNAAGRIQPTLDAVKTSTISDLKDWMERRTGPVDVTFASPGWHTW